MTDDIARDSAAELAALAHRLADAARAETLRHFRRAPAIDNKAAAGFDPVTEADRGAEAAMRALLREARPDDGILGEEEAAVTGTSGLTWILDPVDGTRGFVAGTPTWGVLIAVADATGPRYGIVDQPYIGERFEGGFGRARVTGPLGEAPLRTRATAALAEAVLFTTFPEVGTPAERAAFGRVAGRCRIVRYGMDCYAYALVAAGQADLVIEAGLQPYDIAAPLALVEAAGGVVTDWTGGPAAAGGRVIAAANRDLHAAALALLADEAG